MKKLYTLLFILMIAVACNNGGSGKSDSGNAAEAVQSEPAKIAVTPPAIKINEITQPSKEVLQLTYSDGNQFIFTARGHCEYLLSPNQKAFALNTAVLSNLAITEIYRVGPDGKVDFENPENLSAKVWQLIGMMHNINVDDILNPRAAVMGWDSDRVIEVLVTGETELGQVIDEVVRVEVE